MNFRNLATADCCASRSNNGANLLSGDDLVACHAAGLRAVLAKYGSTTLQLVAEGPTDDKLMDIARATDLVYYMGEDCGFVSPYMEGTDITAEVLAYARAALAKWGTLTPQPVAVSERLPGYVLSWWYEPDEDDDEGYGGKWTLLRIRGAAYTYTHWLPANALPTPETTND